MQFSWLRPRSYFTLIEQLKYINDPFELRIEFSRLMQEFGNYYWMVAWAGKMFPYSEELLNNAHKIKQLVVGLHYFHTHPTFIEAFNPVPEVRFIKSSSRIFLHSKVYLFMNDNSNWEVLIGSPNFTKAALNNNNEARSIINGYKPDIGIRVYIGFASH